MGVTAVVFAVAVLGCDRESASTPTPSPTPVLPLVRSIVTLTDDGGRLGWSAALNRIAFDRAGADGYFDIWTMNPDASAQACLTCNRPGIPTRHVGNPSWHPSGEYIVFQAQKENVTSPVIDFIANPGSGINNDLWVMDAQARQVRRLVTVPIGFGGVLHPHFSSAGSQLQWAERVSNSGGSFGQWVIRVADFRVTAAGPTIDNIRTYTPGAQQELYETHGFGPSDRDILFSGNLESGATELDIYRFNPATGALSNLTATAAEWDEHSHFSPGFNRIAWMSSRGYPRVPDPGQMKTEFWLMNADGSEKTQLTRFNQPGQPEFIPGQALAADLDWGPDGRRIAGYVMTQPAQNRGRIVLIELNISAQLSDDGEIAQRPATGTNSVVRSVHATESDAELSQWEGVLAAMTAAGSLVEQTHDRRVSSRRRVVRFTQYAGGLPVFRGDVVAQFDGRRLVSVFGTFYLNCDPPAATIAPADAVALATRYALLAGSDPMTLFAVPNPNGACGSAYVGRGISTTGPVVVFIDAQSGAFSHELQQGGLELSRAGQAPHSGSPLVTETIAGRTFARDLTRPPGIVTLDLGGRFERTLSALRAFQLADVASVAGSWNDEAVRAFHREAAIAYDFVRTRFGRAGISAGVSIVGMVHATLGTPMDETVIQGPFHAGAGRLFVPERRDGIAVLTTRSVAHAFAQAIVDYTAALAPSGDAGAIRAAFTDMVRSGASDSEWMLADASESATARALAVARTRLEQVDGSVRTYAIERVLFRTVVELLPPNATVAMARKATIQSARDLFGPASGVEAALVAGWSAAGVE